MADITARGLRFHVQRLGAPQEGAPVVVFLHGLVMDNLSSFYFTLANPAAQLGEVVLYDLRGHGKSARPAAGYGLDEMVADLDALLRALSSPRPWCSPATASAACSAWPSRPPTPIASPASCSSTPTSASRAGQTIRPRPSSSKARPAIA
ncbi:MAG: alpha/beta fold hydrolase [Byssovorax sp.]